MIFKFGWYGEGVWADVLRPGIDTRMHKPGCLDPIDPLDFRAPQDDFERRVVRAAMAAKAEVDACPGCIQALHELSLSNRPPSCAVCGDVAEKAGRVLVGLLPNVWLSYHRHLECVHAHQLRVLNWRIAEKERQARAMPWRLRA